MLSAIGLLEVLKTHSVLILDGVLMFTRLASHLKCDILQLQPIHDSNPAIAPPILPQPIINFFGATLSISTDVMDDCWEILQDYVPIMPLMSQDFELFCSNINCSNNQPLQEYHKKVVVSRMDAGVRPAWNTSPYCPSKLLPCLINCCSE